MDANYVWQFIINKVTKETDDHTKELYIILFRNLRDIDQDVKNAMLQSWADNCKSDGELAYWIERRLPQAVAAFVAVINDTKVRKEDADMRSEYDRT
jgi:hypothetical protein